MESKDVLTHENQCNVPHKQMMEKEIFQDLDWGRKNNKNEPNLMIKAFSKLRVGGDYVNIKEALHENSQQTLHSVAKDWPFPSMIRKKK